ncbi:CST complex subunit CTC1 isoform X1 [Quercus lobata]|uniref:CST complex subunit CTC1 isoform X1 n=1 Tax=Quercus lobata TaxID=97700 RepID=UPI001247B2B7|nr:CST complex subunit CTC1 isoform X1 [Quercus lobata]
MDDPTPKLLTISDLIHRNRPITATSSLHSRLPGRPISPKPKPKPKHKPKPPNPTHLNPNPKTLTPLNNPATMIGTLTLPINTSPSNPNPNFRCPYNNNNCLQFSDDSASICCDVLDLDVRIIGKKIRVLAWNFIPLKRGGWFLEIIKWSFLESSGPGLGRCSNVDTFPLVSGSSSTTTDADPKAWHRIHGALEFISPVSVVPCNKRGVNSSLRGFLLQVIACECKLCSSKSSKLGLNDSIREHDTHSYTKPVFVYFCGSASFWHPVIVKLIGKIVMVSGLNMKLVYIGKKESRLMYVTTEKSALHLCRLSKKWALREKRVMEGKGECGSYKGVIRGVYMEGMVVELDNEVWLLLTEHLLTPPHSLRVGALISVRNVHFVNPKFSWKKMLILGACFKTSIVVESFSPLETGSHVVSQLQSMLGKFVESLVFSARLWVLLVISCFGKKFAGMTNEEILGSKHKEGLAQVYASLHLPPPAFRSRHGSFVEVCNHDQCGCGSEVHSNNLKLVMPISSFICHCEATWMRMLQRENDCKNICENNQFNLQSCEGRFYGRSIKKIITSEDMGISLLGSLKVIDYSLIIEGEPHLIDHLGLLDNESVSCRSIFQCIPLARDINLAVYIYFHLRDATCRNLPFYPCIDKKDDFEKLEGGAFHLLRVTHKFPVLHKLNGDMAVSNTSSLFVEAIILPWDLFLNGDGLPTKVSMEQLEEPMECCAGENYQEHASLKRRKIDHASIKALSAAVMYDCSKPDHGLSSCSNSYAQFNEELMSCNLSSYQKISCLITVRGVNCNSMVSSGTLQCTSSSLNGGGGCRPSARKVLLEIKSESFFKYQFLQIGGYYITKHHGDDSFCKKGSGYVSDAKVLLNSGIHMWSLSYAFDEVFPDSNSSDHRVFSSSTFSNNEALSENKLEHLQVFTENSPSTCSDVHIIFPANVRDILEANLGGLEDGLVKPIVPPKEITNDSLSMASTDCSCLFPEGNLSSLRGQVVSFYSMDHSSIDAHLSCESLGDILQTRFFQGVIRSFCIHVLVDHHIVRICGSLNKRAIPIGFGPGAYATFHRILDRGGKNSFMLTPVTFIVINSISAVSEPYNDKNINSWPASDVHNDAAPDTVSSGLISDLIQRVDCKPMRFRCRVVAIHTLVLEKRRNVKYDDLQSKDTSRTPFVDIPFAGFVLDDGSSSSFCWANAERAATLLRLHEKLPQGAFENSGWTSKWAQIDDNACSTIIYHIERIIRNHDRITVKNHGSMFDSSYQDLAVSVSSDNALSCSDENLLKFIIFNACFGTFWNVVASVMDPSTVRQLGKEHLSGMGPTVHAIQNIWAMEVCYSNQLTDGRYLIQELLNR